ncbi:uncharacterized protein LOC134009931 [Osmerus eperlanus]|uniref:uncharacterized protein LOC134009931 n=1 Tax=Osmerus eperlanus TaxID=29151 RepID=UPI002E10306D
MSGEEELSMETSRPTVPTQSGAPAEGVADQAPLVSVRFQKDPHRKLKYLESEPKALGVTQITLSVFQIVSFSFLSAIDFVHLPSNLFNIIGSVVVMVAGVLALAAQNLVLPTLKACLGIQVLASVVSVFNFLEMSTFSEGNGDLQCWEYVYIMTERNSTADYSKTCHTIGEAVSHYQATGILIHAVSLAISVTLAAYCCKVINCCSPTSRMPVITVQAPPTQQ